MTFSLTWFFQQTGRYSSRRGATDGYGRDVNREPRGRYLDRDRKVSEQDNR